MGAVVERLDLSRDGLTELDAVREHLRIGESSEGTEVDAEFVDMGDGVTAVFALDHNPVLEGSLRVYVAGALQSEGDDYDADLTAGEITFAAGSIPGLDQPITASYRYGAAVGVDDAALERMIAGAKRAADQYLNNPFTELRTTIALESVAEGETVTVDGTTFEAAAATDVSEREFDVSGDDAADAAELETCLADAAYGLRRVQVSRSDAKLTLTWRVPQLDPVAASSGADSITVTEELAELDIPDDVAEWVLERVARMYERRASGKDSDSVSGLGRADWGEEDHSLLAPHRVYPGL